MKAFAKIALVVVASVLLLQPFGSRSVAGTGEFPLKDGDVVVMLGDSITAQHLHSNYIEAYCIARFPRLKLQFCNAGVGGSTVPSGLARFDYDVSGWKPTVVTIELGMNDSGPGPQSVGPYMKSMDILLRRIKAAGARPVFFTASPVNDGTTSDRLQGRNITLDKMASAVVEDATKRDIPCADQFHALLDLWGRNLHSQKPIPLTGDGVHPGPTGQLTMAYACLAGLNAPALVSGATIDAATGKVVAAEQCAITDLKVEGNTLSFSRTDECLPMPIPPDARPALQLVPLTEKLNQYTLTVNGLKGDSFTVTIDGAPVATVTAKELSAGWNLSELTKGPIADQCQSILKLVAAKENAVGAWRDVSKFQVPEWLKDPASGVETRKKAELDRRMHLVAAASAKLNQAAQPKPHQFQIAPAK